MSNKKVLVAFLTATIIAAGGSAWATVQGSNQAAGQTAAEKDFSKLSADGSRAYNDVTLARLAIYDGRTDEAKKLIADADTAFSKSKSDDSIFMKTEHDLMTPQQMAAKTKMATASNDAAPETATKTPIAWLPVDGAISLSENYALNPVKKQAVADANQSLAKGDRKGALDKLKLANVDMTVALEVIPLDATTADVHQAAQMIDSGQYYEGSQMLRKVQMAARYDVTDIASVPNTASATAAKPVVGSDKAVR